MRGNPAGELRAIITAARDGYAAYKKTGRRMHLPDEERVSRPGYVRPSFLDGCEVQHAYEKLGVEPDFPYTTEQEWIMDHGNYVAPMIQEPLMWYAMVNLDTAFEPEANLIDEQRKVFGRADGILTLNRANWYQEMEPVKWVLEIKDTEGLKHKSLGEPRLSYALQTLCYMRMAEIKHGAIVIVSKWGYHVYTLEQDGNGYRLYGEDGLPYRPSEVWMDDFNSPNNISFQEVDRRITLLHQTLRDGERVAADGLTPLFVPPIQDPLNHPKGWLCAKVISKPTATKSGFMEVNCPFAGRCHGFTQRKYEITGAKKGEYELKVDF